MSFFIDASIFDICYTNSLLILIMQIILAKVNGLLAICST